MLRDAAVDLIMKRLGNRNSSTLRDAIISEMVFVQENILEGDATLPWFLVTEKAEAMYTIGDERLELPADFLLEWEDGALYYLDDKGIEQFMERDDWDVIQSKVTGTGRPDYYDIVGNYFLVRKIPDDTYTVYMRYYGREASLAGTYGDGNNVENGWLKHASDWFIGEVGSIIASQHIQSEKMAGMFSAQATKGRDRVIRKNTMMQESSKQRFMEG